MKFYLEQLIYALHEDDINLLLQMDLKKSKIKTYLDMLIESRKVGVPAKEEVMKRLDLDENAFRKMRSVILDRCLKELVPEGGTKLLQFLSKYRLHEIFWREADEIIAKIKNDKNINKEDKAMVYLQSIQGYMRLPFSLFSSDKLGKYLKGFSANYNRPDKQTILDAVRLNELFILLVQSFFKVEIHEVNYQYFLKEIKPVEERVVQSGNKRLIAFANGLSLILDFYYKGSSEEMEQGFKNLYEEYVALNDPSVADEIAAVQFYWAYNRVMLSNYKEANDLFAQLKNNHKQVFHYFPHLVLRYVLSLLVVGENKEAKKLMDSYLNRNILVYDADGTIMSCLVYTAWSLLENDVDKAFEYITLYQTVRNKKGLFSFEISMRFYEIIYFYQRGDTTFALSQLKKFVRYLEDKSAQPGIKRSVSTFKNLLGAFNDFVTAKTDLNQFEADLKKMFSGSYSIMTLMFINAAKVRSVADKVKKSSKSLT